MHDQLRLFDLSGKAFRPRPHRVRRGDRKYFEFTSANGAIINCTQDKYGLFWLIKVTHKGRVAFTTVDHEPKGGDVDIQRLIKSLEH